jgi:hypothetical protein
MLMKEHMGRLKIFCNGLLRVIYFLKRDLTVKVGRTYTIRILIIYTLY